jgi:uncharacterized protein (DUF433 family)
MLDAPIAEVSHPSATMRCVDQFKRITFDPKVMGGRACIRGMRVTVAAIVGLLAAGRTQEEILRAYPYLEPDDLKESLAYAAWRLEEMDLPLAT